MSSSDIVGVLVAVIGVISILIKLGRDRGQLDLAIVEAARKAKHDAIAAISPQVAELADQRVHTERYQADQRAIERRLEVLERAGGLDGSGPRPRKDG